MHLKLLMVLLSILLQFTGLSQASQGLIYGTVTTKDGTIYQGQIRWDDEEALWQDVFEAPKVEQPSKNLRRVTHARKKEGQSNDFKLGFMELWTDQNSNVTFPFRCRFGDIVSLKMGSSQLATLSLKNGESIQLKNGRGGDLGVNYIFVMDHKQQKHRLDFKAIQSIYFEPAPFDFKSPAGLPVYGRMLTTSGVFEGYIAWDEEERLGADLISGWKKDTRLDLNFQDIATLKAQEDGSFIQLQSGESLFLNGHDDVNKGNHGIIISGLPFGHLTFTWANFISLTLLEAPKPPASYHSFKAPQPLQGTVSTKTGESYQGQIVYDLDEIYDIEFLNGENNGFRYYIPFEQVDKVEPQNDKFSTVYLKNGNQFLLGNNSDVTNDNHGLVVKTADKQAIYVEWVDIKSIDFE